MMQFVSNCRKEGRESLLTFLVYPLNNIFGTFALMVDLEGKRIAVLLSGGVDSSVAVHEIVQQGLHPDCFYISIRPQEDADLSCTIEEDIEMASAVAAHYGLNLRISDCHQDYWKSVTGYTMNKIRAGLTPNPDVMCNRMIKFGAFCEKEGSDYDLIVTGHYARTEVDSQNRKWLVTSPDAVKDQTDFLAQLKREQLSKALFPIGKYTKDEVRDIAKRENLPNAKRKDSQGICFLGRITYNDYIKKYLGENPGDVVDSDTGRIIGQHRGLWFHTIGQRHGLGFGQGPWYAIKKDLSTNTLFVSKGYDPPATYCKNFTLSGFHFLTEEVPLDDVLIKIRHTPDFHHATITPCDDGKFIVQVDEALQGVAPGQFCVAYDKYAHRCFGSGEIFDYM